jgi:transposase-like protein
MKYIPPSYKSISDMASIDVGRLTEDEARKIFEEIRWHNDIICPHCGSKKVIRIMAKSDKVRDGVIRCNNCRKQFTVTVGTLMEGSHITLRQWVQAFYSMCSHKKGVSALQLQRNLGLGSYRSAWYLSQRIRLAMKKGLSNQLKGTVEVDETYIGGKPRKDNLHAEKSKKGRGTKKIPVLALVERKCNVISKPVENVSSKTLKKAIKEIVKNPD